MSELTPKQRRKIYLEVAEEITKGGEWSLCRRLSRKGNFNNGSYSFDFESMFKNMKEFRLFKPTINERDEYCQSAEWWDIGDKFVRQIVMLLCYEMTKTATP